MRTFLFYLGYFYYLLLVRTVKVKLVGYEKVTDTWETGKKIVFCCVHNSLLGIFIGVDRKERPVITVLASLSDDGELIAKLLIKRRFELIRGSSSRGGKKALLELQRAGLEGKNLGLAFDGPRGPALVPKRGLIGCARAVKGDIYLVYTIAEPGCLFGWPRAFRVGSWDRFLIPVPFCKLTVHFEKLASKEEMGIADENEHELFLLKKIEERAKEVFIS